MRLIVGLSKRKLSKNSLLSSSSGEPFNRRRMNGTHIHLEINKPHQVCVEFGVEHSLSQVIIQTGSVSLFAT